MDDCAAGLALERSDPGVFRELRVCQIYGELSVLIVNIIRDVVGLRHGNDEIGFADDPPVAGIECSWLRRVRWVASRCTAVDPARDEIDFGFFERSLISELPFVLRMGVPGRHLFCLNLFDDGFRPRPYFIVGDEGHGRYHAAEVRACGAMALLAAFLEYGGDIFIEGQSRFSVRCATQEDERECRTECESWFHGESPVKIQCLCIRLSLKGGRFKSGGVARRSTRRATVREGYQPYPGIGVRGVRRGMRAIRPLRMAFEALHRRT